MDHRSWGERHPWSIAFTVAFVFYMFSPEGMELRSVFGDMEQIFAISLLIGLVPILIFLCLPKSMPVARRALTTLFGTVFLPSLVLAALSPMAFDGGDTSSRTMLVVIAFLVMPVAIIIALVKSKRSLRWFLFPLVIAVPILVDLVVSL